MKQSLILVENFKNSKKSGFAPAPAPAKRVILLWLQGKQLNILAPVPSLTPEPCSKLHDNDVKSIKLKAFFPLPLSASTQRQKTEVHTETSSISLHTFLCRHSGKSQECVG